MSQGQPVAAFNGLYPLAYGQIAVTNDYIKKLADYGGAIIPPIITPLFPTIDPPAPPEIPAAPDFLPVVWNAPAAPAPFTEVLTIDDILPAPFDIDPPTLNLGNPPPPFSSSDATLPDAPPIDVNFAYPTLDVSLPAAPSLLSISVSNFSGVNIPDLDYTVPELTLVAPDVMPYTPGATYASQLLTLLKDTLTDRITNGGTGLNPDVENAIWDRGREREAKTLRDSLDAIEQLESLGYALPPGQWLDAQAKVRIEHDYAARGYSREVAIKQAELEQENVKTALTLAVSLEDKLISAYNAAEQRVFEAAKYATEAGVEIYNAKVRGYAAFVDAYKAKISAYEAQIRGELGKVEAYKAQVEAEQAKAQINVALVQAYKAQIDAALSNVEIYKAEIAAIQTKADIEKTKIEIFGEQVKAYGARINAYTAEVEGYKAFISAEATKQTAYKTQVDAYTATVEAATKQIDAKVSAYRSRIEAKNAEFEGYKAAVQAESLKAKSVADNNSALTESYKAGVGAVISYNELLVKEWQVAYEQSQRTAEIAVQVAKMQAELYVTVRQLAAEAAKVGAQVSAQLASAVMNVVHFSDSDSYSSSDSRSTSTSTSENTNRNISV